ncbi:hypothetical protein [Pararobbsia silviterrae]|uniref:Uncharacterized protein n=1 Tax=Pararobbsia silviterrae TaxID=1792498 RepID=A0A494XZH1_9BURK|nr:hypothetical protein [Pararobbsia silviterrae]RKP55922.1 hypothetical protein D7S86_12035 [Pararobbsia silviterrae]
MPTRRAAHIDAQRFTRPYGTVTMTPRNLLMSLTALVALAGCASPIVYRDPQTGHTAQCATSNVAGLPSAKQDIDQCSAMLEHMGWVRE